MYLVLRHTCILYVMCTDVYMKHTLLSRTIYVTLWCCVRLYRVVVMEESAARVKRAVNVIDLNDVQPEQCNKCCAAGCYIAGELLRKQLPMTFTIGDNKRCVWCLSWWIEYDKLWNYLIFIDEPAEVVFFQHGVPDNKTS